jgi:hypothetical protein
LQRLRCEYEYFRGMWSWPIFMHTLNRVRKTTQYVARKMYGGSRVITSIVLIWAVGGED